MAVATALRWGMVLSDLVAGWLLPAMKEIKHELMNIGARALPPHSVYD